MQTPKPRNRNMKQIHRLFKLHTTALSLFLQSIGSFTLGVILLRHQKFFMARVTEVIFLYFVFISLTNFLHILLCFRKGLRKLLQSILTFFVAGIVTQFLWHNIDNMFQVIPIALTMWMMLYAASNFMSYAQYHSEQNTTAIRYFVQGMVNIGFAVFFILRTQNQVFASFRVLGVYAIVLGSSLFLDGLSEALPATYQAYVKHRIRVAPPVLLVFLAPQKLLDVINDFFRDRRDNVEIPPNFCADNRLSDGADKPNQPMEPINVEVFIHVSKNLAGTAGHVDIAIEDTIYSYGTYDKGNIRCGGVLGAGVMYEVSDKQTYLTVCRALKDEAVFGFGMTVRAQEITTMKEQIAELKSRAYDWHTPSQVARARGQSPEKFVDFPSRFAMAMDVQFYKFHHGTYKYYWMLGTNCVTFVEELLKVCGMPRMLAGFVSPGTYYHFLNKEFLQGTGAVVKRTVYAPLHGEKA